MKSLSILTGLTGFPGLVGLARTNPSREYRLTGTVEAWSEEDIASVVGCLKKDDDRYYVWSLAEARLGPDLDRSTRACTGKNVTVPVSVAISAHFLLPLTKPRRDW